MNKNKSMASTVGRVRVRSLNPWRLFLSFRSARLLTVEPVVFLFMFATYLTFPLSSQYYLNRYSRQVLRNTSYPYLNQTRCINKSEVDFYTGSNTTYDSYVEGKSTLLYVFTSAAGTVPSVVMTMVLGPLSDRFGRHLPILLVAVSKLLQGALDTLIVQLELDLHLSILSNAVGGLSGGFAGILMASYAYVSDISSGKWRTVRIGLVEAMIFLAGLISEELGGLWFERLDCDMAPPLYLFLGCHAGIFLYTLLFLPPSLTGEERRLNAQPGSSKRRRGVRALARGASLFCAVPEYPAWRLWLAIVAVAIFVINMTAATSIGVFFFGELNWSSSKIGAYGATTMASHMVVLMGVMPVLVALKFPDPLLSIVGGLVNCTMNLLIGLSKRTFEIFIAGVVGGLDAMMVPPLRAYMSKLVRAEDQGALFSVIASVESLATLVSIAYTYVFPDIVRHLTPGYVYLLMAALGLVPIPLISVLLLHWFRARLTAKLASSKVGISEKAPLLQEGQPGKKGGLRTEEIPSAPPPQSYQEPSINR